MDKIAKSSEKFKPDSDKLDVGDDADFKPMSAQEAASWRAKQKHISMWRVIKWQLSASCLAGLVAGLLAWQWSFAVSALYGGIAVVFPAAVMVWGMTAGRLTQLLSAFAKGSLFALIFWEAIKVVLSIFMLAMAPMLLKDLNWPALVASFVLVIKVYWLAFFLLTKAT
jgi:ATP synthase protein I